MSNSTVDISADFNSISDEEWKALVEKDLKGKDFAETLVWHNDNGILLQPYYRSSDVAKIKNPERFRSISNDWVIQQDFEDSNDSNSAMLEALERGATGLGLHLKEKSNLSSLLSEIYIDAIPVEFNGQVSENTLKQLIEVAKEKNIPPSAISGVVAFKPLSSSAVLGSNQSLDGLAEVIKSYSDQLSHLKFIQIDASIVKNAGGNEHQEIVFALAQANEYIDRLTDKGIAAETVISNFSFKFAFGTSYFTEIAKVRAFRFLIQSLYKQYGVDTAVEITATTAAINYAAKDSYTNLLRATTSAMSAAVGGCDRLVVLPYDCPFEEQSTFAKRIARNIQIVLQEEAHLSKVKDAAAGSYYIEQLSDELAQKSWELFQAIESMGGFTLSLSQNKFQDLIAINAAEVLSELKDKKRVQVGVNKYEPAKADDKKLKSVIAQSGNDYKALTPIRWSAIFEGEAIQ